MMLTQENLPVSVPRVDPAALQTLMCRAGLAVAVLDGSGRLSMLSPRLEHLLHRPFAVVPAESLAEVFHLYSEDGARLLRPHEVPIVRASRGEVVEDAIVTVKAPGQPVRHLRVNATPMVGLNGERQGAWAVMTDVTSLVAAARGELSRSLAETVNHNLRTPLTTILGHAELLIDQQDEFPPGAASSLEAVWRAGQHLNDVVTWISEWIDLAYTPDGEGEGEGKGADLAEYLDRYQRP
jgi:signal transduction histidine kinase